MEADFQISIDTARRILSAWGCSTGQIQQILGLANPLDYGEEQCPGPLRPSSDQVERASHILGIHAALRTVFENPKNLYGFMSMPNRNPGFDGVSPLELIEDGDLEELVLVARRVQALAEGGW